MFKRFLDRAGTYKYDVDNVYGSVMALPLQIEAMWNDWKTLKMPVSCKQADNLVIVGMGGSALGARVVRGLDRQILKLPLDIVNDYHLPTYVDANSLVVLSSYSGNTEEVLSVAEGMKKNKLTPVVVTTGGKLAKMAKEQKWPAIIFEAKHNPSHQPRVAVGYAVMAQLLVLARCGHIELSGEQIKKVVKNLSSSQKELGKEQPTKKNIAKQLAEKLNGKGVVLISGEHLTGAVHVFKNQLNENAKTFAVRYDLPELNHHLLEGIGFPPSLRKNLHFVLFESDLYSGQIHKRLALTEEVISKQGYGVSRVQTEGKTEFEQVWEVMQFGGFVGVYLAMLNRVNPAEIPWVDWFKDKMKE